MKVSVITNRGVGIVRSAANRHEKCEIVDAVSSTHFENTASELATKPLEWFDGVVGTITMVRAGNGSLKVSVSFPATSYAQPLKSVGIRVKAQGDERAHVLYAVSDGNTAIALNRPYTCDYEIPINVSSDTIADVGSEPVPGLEDYYTKTETDTAIGNAITALNLGAASQKGVDTSIGDASSSNLPTSDAVKAYVNAHSGGGGDTSNLGASIAYDSNTKKIELKNANGVTISEIDATAFVKDGMLDSVTVSDGNLNFVFNTDAGKETISIPMSSFFDASAYYTKTEIDANLGNYYTKSQVDNKGYCTEADVGLYLSGYYTKSEVDVALVNYCTKSEVDADLENYYTKTEIDNKGYCTKHDVDGVLLDYYTKSQVDNKGYCTEAEVNTKLENSGSSLVYDSKTKKIGLRNADGVTLSKIDATAFVKDGMVNNVAIVGDYLVITFNTDAGKEAINIPMSSFFDASSYYTKQEINDGYYSKVEINDELNHYYTKTEINNGYYTKSEVDANHYTKAEINNGYYSKSQVDTNLENYYTKAEINDGYYTKSQVDANHYTKTEIDNKGYCTEAEVNVNHYTKSEIDGGYIANASYNSNTNTLTLSSKDGSKQINLDLS